MSDAAEHPVEILWRMQQQAMAAGHALPQREREKPKWRGLAFGVGELRLVAELTGVTDVSDCPRLTPVPGTRGWLRGVCNLRGSLYSVVDLGMFLNISPPLETKAGKLLVLNYREFGCTLLVHRVYGLRYFDQEQRGTEISRLERAVHPYIEGTFLHDEQVWGVLDFDRLVTADAFLDIT